MRKIIGGKMYNTETATNVGEYENLQDISASNYYQEILYKKKTGEIFLYGKGNARCKYGVKCEQNVFSPGENIIPLTEEDAKIYAEKYLGVDEYIALFGEPEE